MKNNFLASVKCPKCHKAADMRVSNNKDYAYRCMSCNNNFHSFECPDTNDLYEITLCGQSYEWYKKHLDLLRQICGKYKADFMGCRDLDPEKIFIDFGWEKAPDDKRIQDFTDEIINVIKG